MGWQDRDYAKWTDAERRRFLGPGTARAGRPHTARRHLVRPGARKAIVVAAALLALGQFPRDHPILPALHIGLSGAQIPFVSQTPPARNGTIGGPSTATTGTFVNLHGTAPSGPVTIQGSYDGAAWRTLATAVVDNGAWDASVAITQQGTLHLRVIHPDGSQDVGTITVQ